MGGVGTGFPAYQCARVEGGPTCSTEIPATPARLPCAAVDKQCGCSSLHQWAGSSHLCRPAHELWVSPCPLSLRAAQVPGLENQAAACPEEAQAWENGGSTHRWWQRSGIASGQWLRICSPPGSRPTAPCSSPLVQTLGLSVAPRSSVCVSPLWSPSSPPAEDLGRESAANADSPKLASHSLVLRHPTVDMWGTMGAPSPEGSAFTDPRGSWGRLHRNLKVWWLPSRQPVWGSAGCLRTVVSTLHNF